jgi:TRAP-type C4-dicarboxylate transport system permease small subunit
VSEPVPGRPAAPPRAVAALAAIVRLWAVAGGLIAVALAVMSALSAISNLALGRPFPADYELVKHLTAIIIFMFLPYCQLTGANVTVDIFTEGMGERPKAAMAFLASLLAIGFSLLLLRQMWLGWSSYLVFVETTPILGLPLWTAFPPMIASLALLFATSLATAADSWRRLCGGAGWRLDPGRAIEESIS